MSGGNLMERYHLKDLCEWEDNVKLIPKKQAYLALDRYLWQAVANIIRKLKVPQ
jgi:hypothetical protein